MQVRGHSPRSRACTELRRLGRGVVHEQKARMILADAHALCHVGGQRGEARARGPDVRVLRVGHARHPHAHQRHVEGLGVGLGEEQQLAGLLNYCN